MMIGERSVRYVVVVVGRDGAGKSEQARRLAGRLGLGHVSVGSLLRDARRQRTPLGVACEPYVIRGELVPDDIVAGIVAARLAEVGPLGAGLVLDGFPRSVAQAERLAQLLQPAAIDLAIHLDVPRSIAVERIQNRRECTVCGATNPHVMRCHVCGGATARRADDVPATIGRQMSDHARDIGPLLEWLRVRDVLVEVDGRGTPEEVERRIVTFAAALGTSDPGSARSGHRTLLP